MFCFLSSIENQSSPFLNSSDLGGPFLPFPFNCLFSFHRPLQLAIAFSFFFSSSQTFCTLQYAREACFFRSGPIGSPCRFHGGIVLNPFRRSSIFALFVSFGFSLFVFLVTCQSSHIPCFIVNIYDFSPCRLPADPRAHDSLFPESLL